MIRERLVDEGGMAAGVAVSVTSTPSASGYWPRGKSGRCDRLTRGSGFGRARLDILSDAFLERVAVLDLALETLHKLLNEQIRVTERSNIVQSRKFREALEDGMLPYMNKAISTAELIHAPDRTSEELARCEQRGIGPGRCTDGYRRWTRLFMRCRRSRPPTALGPRADAPRPSRGGQGGSALAKPT